MPSIIVLVLFAVISDAYAEELVNAANTYDNMIDRALKLSRYRPTGLDDAVLEKGSPSLTWCDCLACWRCSAAETFKRPVVGNSSQSFSRSLRRISSMLLQWTNLWTIPSSQNLLLRIRSGGLASLELGLDGQGPGSIDMPDSGSAARTLPELYRVGTRIDGEGGSGVVRPAIHLSTQKPCAVKLVNKSTAGKRYISSAPRRQEWQLRMSQANRTDNVVRYLDLLESREYFFVVMERLSGMELFEYVIKKAPQLTEAFCKDVMLQVFEALRFLHDECRVIHRDVKLENFRFRTPGKTAGLALFDFGQMCFLDEPCDKGIMGTVPYISPEVSTANAQPHLFPDSSSPYTTAVDMWAAGVMLFILLTGEDPFTDEEIWDLGKPGCDSSKMLARALQHERLCQVSGEAVDLLTKLLHVNPKERISASQALGHPWFTSSAFASKPLAVPRTAYATTSVREGHQSMPIVNGSIFHCRQVDH
eukprot:gnl/TRDRNA2_/TRDRNA2_176350_c0_seq16.p1 gnl/TRDRNA2_/TRDRNA2_176350_c0~~gnl/TRDRNA2_/TRDRNA2_176350_c0_seq16.p1  ORF type:complete len:476 (+),score=47.68 gnl/TRDRNA2_/TRDRNA2_176350_c0_seq16:196-1623(+)